MKLSLLAATLLALSACKYNPKVKAGVVACDPANPKCPQGFTCIETQPGAGTGTCGNDVGGEGGDGGFLATPDAMIDVAPPARDLAADIAAAPVTDATARDTTGATDVPLPRDVAAPIDGPAGDLPAAPNDLVGAPGDLAPVPPDLAIDTTPDAMVVACPSGRGPTMVNVGSFCIDSTEVTNRQYAVFLADATVDLTKQPAVCIGKNTDYRPDNSDGAQVDNPARLDHPVVNIDWCDASAFCKWAGKRLCGKIGGGSLAPGEAAFPDRSQWAYACTRAGTRAYPWGEQPKTGACQLGQPEALPIRTVAVRTGKPECVGGFDGIHDMVGNAEEWVDSCQQAGSTLECGIIGGGYIDGSTARCDQYYEDPMVDEWRARSFRCCSL